MNQLIQPNQQSQSSTITNKKRAPRFQRLREPPLMIMQERDRAIVRAVWQYQVLTREQIQRLIFPTTRNEVAARRLKKLYHNQYLERVPLPIRTNLWPLKPVYRIAANGAAMLAFEQHIPVEDLEYWGRRDERDHRTTDVTMLYLNHMLAINDIRIAVTLAATREGFTLERWIEEVYFKTKDHKDYVEITTDHDRKRKMPVLPDGYFVLTTPKRAHFMFEVDRATETDTSTTSDWRAKIRTYIAYMTSGKYTARFKTRSLRVLTFTTSRQRIANMKQTTEDEHGEGRFWFTTFELATPENILTAPIWYKVGDPNPHTLIERSDL